MAPVTVQATNSEYYPSVPRPPMSDYGSDIDFDDVQEDTGLQGSVNALSTFGHEEILHTDITKEAQNELGAPRSKHLAVVHLEERATRTSLLDARSASLGTEYNVLSNFSSSISRQVLSYARPSLDPGSTADDTRAPIVRFRTKPKKPLSVTDLVSPAWCELQYSYTLSKFGRKPRTQAMKQGSKIHQALENEVFTEVFVETVTKEDRFGLRIWNTIQRLRTLHETGLTRELEIWGIVEGQVINGVIDELSFACPDTTLGEEIETSMAQRGSETLPPDQLSIEQSFSRVASAPQDDSANIWLGIVQHDRPVYICDVKTRSRRSLPSKAASRQTSMQLMLYRKLLESLVLNTVDAESVFVRYDLASSEPFSEAFLSGGGRRTVDGMDPEAENAFNTFQTDELRAHPNLLSIWSLMINEIHQAIPSISHLLRAEYRYAKTGEVIGNELIIYNVYTIDAYIRQEMEWWNGNREARGVEIEEAFKCQKCDFAEMCTWRRDKVEEMTQGQRSKRVAR